MKQIFVLLIIGFALLSAACSWTSQFIVVNDSSDPVKVVYTLASAPPDATGYSPKMINVSDLETKNWQALGSREYLIDLRARTVTVVLPAQKALLVFGISNYTGHNRDQSTFPLREIALSGASGEIVLSDDQARRSFVNESKDNYYLRYK